MRCRRCSCSKRGWNALERGLRRDGQPQTAPPQDEEILPRLPRRESSWTCCESELLATRLLRLKYNMQAEGRQRGASRGQAEPRPGVRRGVTFRRFGRHTRPRVGGQVGRIARPGQSVRWRRYLQKRPRIRVACGASFTSHGRATRYLAMPRCKVDRRARAPKGPVTRDGVTEDKLTLYAATRSVNLSSQLVLEKVQHHANYIVGAARCTGLSRLGDGVCSTSTTSRSVALNLP